jgi:CRISPR-associated protein Cas1
MSQSTCLASFQKSDSKHLQLLVFTKEVKTGDNILEKVLLQKYIL